MHPSGEDTIYHFCLLRTCGGAFHASLWLPCYSGATSAPLVLPSFFLYIQRDFFKCVLAYRQRVLEHCDDESTQNAMMEEIMQSVVTLTEDQYGNYVIQVTVYSFPVLFSDKGTESFFCQSFQHYLLCLLACVYLISLVYYDQIFQILVEKMYDTQKWLYLLLLNKWHLAFSRFLLFQSVVLCYDVLY